MKRRKRNLKQNPGKTKTGTETLGNKNVILTPRNSCVKGKPCLSKAPRPEQQRCVIKAFLLGIAATVPAFLITNLFSWLAPPDLSPIVKITVKAFLIAGLVEETCKLAVVKKYLMPLPQFDKITNAIIHTMAVALGFAFLENLLYFTKAFQPWRLLLIRGLTALPLHGLSAGIMGYFLGRAHFEGDRKIIPGFLMAILYHGLYDFFLFTDSILAYLNIPLLIILAWHAKILICRGIRKDRQTSSKIHD